jgi:hypothetical protein
MRVFSNKFLMMISISIILFACGRGRKNKDTTDEPLLPLTEPTPPSTSPPQPPSNDSGKPTVENDRPLRLRGYDEYSLILENSLIDTYGAFSLSIYLGGIEDLEVIGELGKLMGFYSSEPLNSGWKNVSPNTVSTSIYLMAVTKFANHLAYVACSDYGISETSSIIPIQPKSSVVQLIRNYCQNGSNTSVEVLGQIWDRFTTGLSTEAEKVLWIADIKAVADRSLSERLEFMMTTAMLTPELIFHLYKEIL